MNEQECRLEAEHRFQSDPSKCFQRHIREVYDEQEARPKLTSLKSAIVTRVSNIEAKAIITKYEWLKTMGAGTKFCYGLKLNDELLGVACFNVGGSHEARNVCGPETISKTLFLCRGACVPHAPKDAGSFLVRHACRLAHKDFGYEVFLAYSDPDAGEIGTIYQAVGWKFLGPSLGRGLKKRGRHLDFIAPDGKRLSSKNIYPGAVRLGWTDKSGVSKRDFLRSLGYMNHWTADKDKWVWFENKQMESQCRFPFLSYPKRKGLSGN